MFTWYLLDHNGDRLQDLYNHCDSCGIELCEYLDKDWRKTFDYGNDDQLCSKCQWRLRREVQDSVD